MHRQGPGIQRYVCAQDMGEQDPDHLGISFQSEHQSLAHDRLAVVVQQLPCKRALLVTAPQRTTAAELIAGLEGSADWHDHPVSKRGSEAKLVRPSSCGAGNGRDPRAECQLEVEGLGWHEPSSAAAFIRRLTFAVHFTIFSNPFTARRYQLSQLLVAQYRPGEGMNRFSCFTIRRSILFIFAVSCWSCF